MEAVNRWLEEMPESSGILLRMRFMLDMSWEDIGIAANLSVRTVRDRVSLILDYLKAKAARSTL
jgi:DNA-directed RNA polymerase specialized sigma24 family protein